MDFKYFIFVILRLLPPPFKDGGCQYKCHNISKPRHAEQKCWRYWIARWKTIYAWLINIYPPFLKMVSN